MKRLRLIKTILWFVLSEGWAFFLIWLFLGDVAKSLLVTAIIGGSIFVGYYYYEIVWEKIYKKYDGS